MNKVIERIVESEGAPNENDLWLNGTTLKKFQNGEWTVIPGGCMGEDEEYTIAQALNDLNGKIEALEAKLVQELHVLKILDVGVDLTLDNALNLLELDGKKPTFEQLASLNPAGLILQSGEWFFGISRFCYNNLGNRVYIEGGKFMDSESTYEYYTMEINGDLESDDSYIEYYEV